MKRFRILLYSLLTTFILSIPLGVLEFNGIYLFIKKAQQDIELTAGHSAKLISALLEQNISQLKALSRNTLLEDPGTPLEDRLAEIQSYADMHQVARFYITDTAGKGVGLGDATRDFSGTAFFSSAAGGVPVIGNPEPFTGEAQLYYPVCVPLYQGNRFTGTLIQYMPWDEITRLIESLNFEKEGFAYIRDRNRSFTSHPDTSTRELQLADPEDNIRVPSLRTLGEIQRRISGGEAGSGQYSYKGKTTIVGFAPIKNTSWALGIIISRDEVLSRITTMYVIVIVLILVIFLGTYIWYSRMFSLQHEKERAILALTEANRKLREQACLLNEMAQARIEVIRDIQHIFVASKHYLEIALEIARNHHERYDGTGYPDALAGDRIPLAARIVAICDVYDALISERPYKKAFPKERALSIIREASGTQFDPLVVDCFIGLFESGDL